MNNLNFYDNNNQILIQFSNLIEKRNDAVMNVLHAIPIPAPLANGQSQNKTMTMTLCDSNKLLSWTKNAIHNSSTEVILGNQSSPH